MSNNSITMKFILSRTKDYENHSKKWVIGYGLLFWLITRIIAVMLVLACTLIYNKCGIYPEQMTKFVGNPTNVNSVFSAGYGLLMISVIAPILEECIFRLGLSFKKWQIALAVSAIPTYILFQRLNTISLKEGLIYAASAIVLFSLVYCFSSQKMWDRLRHGYFNSAVWITSIAFGLLHLIAFSPFSLMLLPYMLCVITVPFFAGCAITYYRVNLGFWWGVGLHIFNNLPAIVMIASL